MTQYSAFEMWTAIVTTFMSENEPIIYRESASDDGRLVERVTHTAGFPAYLIESSESDAHVNEIVDTHGIGHPQEIFVHAGDLATLTGCSLESGRNWLGRFYDQDLLGRHGEGATSTEEGSEAVSLYYPLPTAPKQVMRTLYELDNGTYPDTLGDLEPVTPGQFIHRGDALFAFDRDDSVIVDVEKPADRNVSLQQYVNEQLHPHGLTASSPKNFIHSLRKQGGVI